MKFTQEHEELRRSLRIFIDREINPHIEEWEDAEIFPARELFKKMGDEQSPEGTGFDLGSLAQLFCLLEFGKDGLWGAEVFLPFEADFFSDAILAPLLALCLVAPEFLI